MMERVAFDVNRRFGVEIEAYGPDKHAVAQALTRAGIECHTEHYHHETRSAWKIVPDCTIYNDAGEARGDDTWELVSPPMNGLEALESIRKVCATLATVGAKVNKTCGLHVHHDARHWTLKEFKNCFALYGRMEETLDEAMPESRRGNANTYCQSMRNLLAHNHEAFKACKSWEDFVQWLNDASGDRARYYKVNVTARTRHNTIEFRHHSGTVEAEKIINWIILTQLICAHSEGKAPSPKFDRESRFKNMNPYYLLTGDLVSIRRSFADCSQEVQDCIHYYCDRINHFRKVEAKGQPIRMTA